MAFDTTENLRKSLSHGSQIIVEIAAPLEDLQVCWEQMPELQHFDVAPADADYFRCSLTPTNGEDLRPQIFSLVTERGWKLRELSRHRYSLEDIYVRVTRPQTEEELI